MFTRIVDTDSKKLALINRVREEGLEQTLIYTLDKCSDEHWLDILKYSWVISVHDEDETAGFCWFDNQNGYSAWCHYVLFRSHMHVAEEAGFLPIQFLEISLKVKTLLGLTPKVYRQSRSLMQAWGFKQIGVVPYGCYLAKYKRYTDGILYMRTT